LKATYKATTGLEWKPTTTTENKSAVDPAVKKEAPVKKMEKVYTYNRSIAPFFLTLKNKIICLRKRNKNQRVKRRKVKQRIVKKRVVDSKSRLVWA
jgi:hypothetical protein